MPSINKLTDSEERILLALWKLKGIGNNHIREASLKADLAVESSDDHWTGEIAKLQNQGFLDTVTVEGHNIISLTPLGLAILRQIEEDKLQELK
jgi:DNA-binding MarR family transcriptional regulator